MFHVLIAEDIKPIARNVQSHIERIEPRAHVVATAYNGLDALEILKKEPIDILVTDIRMPMMDGLSLIEAASSFHPRLKSILLTGYNDFEYARKAIQLNVCDYLLKPLDSVEFERVLKKLVTTIENHKNESNDLWLSKCLHQDHIYHNPEMQASRYLKIVIRYGLSPSNRSELTHALLRYAFNGSFPDHACSISDGHTLAEKVMLVPLGETQDEQSILSSIQALFHKLQAMNSQIHMAYHIMTQGAEHIRTCYTRLRETLDHQIVLNTSQLLRLSEGDTEETRLSESEIEKLNLQFQTLMKHGGREEFIQDFKHSLDMNEDQSVWLLKQRLMIISEAISKKIEFTLNWEREIEQIIRISSSCAQVVDTFIMRCVLPYYDKFKSRKNNVQETLEAIDCYLSSNLYKNITLQSLADELNYSVSYIIRIFKKSRGMTPMEYFNQLKISEAKKLIVENEKLLFKDIADALGFTDQHYFTKVFKQYTGKSPSEFKQDHIVNRKAN
ncbi:response regulator transcription factor [Marinicrinis lubricantis]|uniref:Response regulator n=1 Tax=Marinicrinis lubricantis TaxID=2086470 RepID=A0ABW1IVU7_9BACL